LAGLGYGDPHSSGRGEVSKERRAWEPAPKAAASRLGAGLGGAFMGGLDACVPSPARREQVSSGSRASRLTSTRPMPRPPPVTTQERSTSTPWPRSESRPPSDSPCTRSEHVRRFFACLNGPDRPGSSHPFTA